MTTARRIHVRLLGPVEAAVDGGRVPLGGDRQRALLAMLALAQGAVVSRDRLIAELWGDDPPGRAEQSLQMQVSRLRKALAEAGSEQDRLLTRGSGYMLRLEDGERDIDAWAAALERARRARAEGDTELTRRLLLEADGLWRGAPLADVSDGPILAAERALLEERRLGAVLERIDVDLAQGAHDEVLGELERLIAEHPFQERIRAQHMLALYRAGRQADALAAYRAARARLVDELGIEPSAALQSLEAQILQQDPALNSPQAPSRSSEPPDASTGCPTCEAPIAAGDRFCRNCGSALIEAAVAEERKVVSVLACGVADGYGPSDPEDRRAALEPVRAGVERIVEGFGGTVATVAGETLLCVFGAPRAREDDAERAIRAGLEVVSADPMFAAAVDTGDALVTLLDHTGRSEPPAVGEVLARCLRLQQSASPGEIIVGERARNAARDAFDFELLSLAGAGSGGEPLAVFRPVLRDALGDYVAHAVAPLVGREDELDLLCRMHARAVRELSAQLVTVVGEPGMGKSRLITELRSRLDAEPLPVTWAQGRCLPYGEGVAFWALAEVVKAQAGILESDTPDDVRGKLAALVAPLERDRSDREWLEGRLAPLVGLGESRSLGGPDRGEAFTAWRRFVEALAAGRSLTLVFEDVHWADGAFLEFVEQLVEWLTGVSILIVCTARPEFLESRPGWGRGARNATVMTLPPLTAQETDRLVRALLDRSDLPDEAQSLPGRSGGNPLHAIELVRMLRDGVADPAAVPETVQAVIAARLDTLSLEDKRLLQDAAVVGKVFWAGAVAAVSGKARDEMEDRLHALARRDFIRRARVSSARDEIEYTFAHILVRDVAYGQIPRTERLAKHRAAAAWLQELAGDRVSLYAEVLADHYERALELATADGGLADPELEESASRFLTLAADRVTGLDPVRAEQLYGRALELVVPTDAERGVLLARLADVAFRAHSFEVGERRFLDAVAALRENGQVREAGEATVRLAYVARGRGETRRASALAREAVHLLEREPAGPELALAYAQVAVEHFFAGRSTSCTEWSDKALRLTETLGAPQLRVRPLQLRGMARCELGDLGGLEDLRDALRLGLDLGLGLETAQSYGNLAIWVWRTDGPATALELNAAAVELCRDKGIASWVAWVEAESVWMLLDLGRFDDIIAIAADAERHARTGGARYPLAIVTPYLVAAHMARGDLDLACTLAEGFLPQARAIGDTLVLAPALAFAAEADWRRGRADPAVALVDEWARVTAERPTYRNDNLPGAVEIVARIRGAESAAALLPDGEPAADRHRNAVLSARAILMEAAGDGDGAPELFSEAETRWHEFGSVLEVERARGRHAPSWTRPAS